MNFKAMPMAQKKSLYLRAKRAYYNDQKGKSPLTDAQFDKLEELIREEDPDWTGFAAGAPVKNKKTKATLPIPIFSLDKVKKPEQVQRVLEAYEEYVLMDKLDGASLELQYIKGVLSKMYTRGNGKIGGDVSFLIPHLKGVPQKAGTKDFIVRCEGLFTKAAFQKYKKDFDAPRNAASGVLNRTDIHHSLKDLQVVALQLLAPSMKFSMGLSWLKRAGFRVVAYRVVKSAQLNFNILAKLLQKRKANSPFECDGLVLVQNKKVVLPKSGNPDWGVAFKETVEVEDAPIATVKQIHWKVSAHAYLIPRVEIEPVKLSGATIRFAAAKNAKLLLSMGIGPGAKVRLVRSGDIIPDIVKVEKKVKADLPDPAVVGDYHWDKNKVNIVLDNPKESSEFRVQKIARTFDRLKIDFLRGRTVERLIDAGYDNVSKILRATAKDFEDIEGFKATSAKKLYDAIHSKTDEGFPIVQLMDASGCFPRGMGSTLLQEVVDNYNLLQLSQQPLRQAIGSIMKLPGFQIVNATKVAKGLPLFIKWLRATKLKIAKPKKVKLSSSKLEGVSVSWTGYRDKDQEATVIQNGGSIVSWSPRRTTVLLYKAGGKASGKVDAAKEAGVPALSWEQFSKKYRI